MPSTELVEMSADLDVFRVGELLAKSGYFTDVRDMAQAVAKILAGREMGFGAIASLLGVYIQNGRPCYSANMIAAAIKKSRRYDYRVKLMDGQSCELEFYEGGKPVGVSTFSLRDAEQAGLTIGKNAHSWKHYPRNMLFARALTNGARFYCPDTFGGIPVYTPEEMGVVIDGESGEVSTAQPVVSLALPSPVKAVPTTSTRYVGEPGDGPLYTTPMPDAPNAPHAPFAPDVAYTGIITKLVPRETQGQDGQKRNVPGHVVLRTEQGPLQAFFWERPESLRAVEDWAVLIGQPGSLVFYVKEDKTGTKFRYVREFQCVAPAQPEMDSGEVAA